MCERAFVLLAPKYRVHTSRAKTNKEKARRTIAHYVCRNFLHVRAVAFVAHRTIFANRSQFCASAVGCLLQFLCDYNGNGKRIISRLMLMHLFIVMHSHLFRFPSRSDLCASSLPTISCQLGALANRFFVVFEISQLSSFLLVKCSICMRAHTHTHNAYRQCFGKHTAKQLNAVCSMMCIIRLVCPVSRTARVANTLSLHSARTHTRTETMHSLCSFEMRARRYYAVGVPVISPH